MADLLTTVSADWRVYLNGFRQFMMLERSLSPHSIEAYLRDVIKLAQFIELSASTEHSPLSPLALQRQHLENFLAWLSHYQLEASSQARIVAGIRAFYKYLLMEDIIMADPSALLESPKKDRKLPDVLSVNEVEAILAAIDLSHPQGTRNRAIVEVLYACGLRVSELIHLKLTNLFLEVGFVKILGKNNKERLVPIGDEAIKHLRFYLAERNSVGKITAGFENFVFLNRRGKSLTRNMIFIIIQELAKKASIQKNIGPHTFRHTFATHLIEGGADLRAIQDMLGHESITTTELYTHLDSEYLKDTILHFHPRNRPRE